MTTKTSRHATFTEWLALADKSSDREGFLAGRIPCFEDRDGMRRILPPSDNVQRDLTEAAEHATRAPSPRASVDTGAALLASIAANDAPETRSAEDVGLAAVEALLAASPLSGGRSVTRAPQAGALSDVIAEAERLGRAVA